MQKSNKNPYLHGARGIFSFSILIFHVLNSSIVPISGWNDASKLAALSLQFGVELFFGISGIVIIGAHGRARTTTQFILERCARIYPVLWATVFAILAGSVLMHRAPIITPDLAGLGALAANLAAIPNIIPVAGGLGVPIINPAAWTLTLEFCFYVLVGLYLSHARIWRPLSGMVIIAVGVLLVSLQFRAIFFLSGIAIHAGVFERGWLLRITRFPLFWLPVFLCCWTLGAMRLGMPTGLLHLAWSGLVEPVIPALIAAGWISGTLALAGIVRGEGLFGRLCLSRPVQWLGTISYSLYLWQAPIMGGMVAMLIKTGLAERAGPWGKVELFLVALGPILLVSSLSHRYLEIKATNWLRRKIDGNRPAR